MTKKFLNLAIVGYGFVGGAVDYGFPDTTCNKTIIDPKCGTSVADLVGKDIEVSFVCVPTPMSTDGSIDASILVSTVTELLEHTEGLVVIKSTVIPSIIEQLTITPRVIYNPEFLTEKSANEDFVNPIMHVFGGDRERAELLEFMYKHYSNCKPCPVWFMSATEASLVKYGMNSYLASKVLWFNQFYDLVSATDSATYATVINAMTTDPRIGSSHTSVPGHDGRRGYGGSCFAKDVPALIKYATSIDCDLSVLREVVRRNQDYRNSYDEPLPRELEQNIRYEFEV